MYQVKIKVTANHPDNVDVEYYNTWEAREIIEKYILNGKVDIEYDIINGNERETSYLFDSKELFTQLDNERLSYENENPDCVNDATLEFISQTFLS